jgi:hypothetical protein
MTRQRLKRRQPFYERIGGFMTIGTILLVILILILVGVLPAWPHSRSWGYGPTGGIGLVLVVLVILLVLGVV